MIKFRYVAALLVLAAFVPLALGTAIFAPGPLEDTKTIVIPHGAHVADIGTFLTANGVTLNPILFRAAARILAADELKAGEYQFAEHVSIADAVEMMRDGRAVIRLFTMPEGLTSAETAALLEANPALSGEIALPAEGSLLPETYRYSYSDSRAALVARMQKSMQEALAELWPGRDPALPLKSPAEAVILASIVEKETGKKEERPRIAGVFYNRLKVSMRLQSDPTVIYALTNGKGPLGRELTRDDLERPSPYNTYTSDGLPPGPICNPGRASLAAVLHPETNDFLYFVADGTGGHVFAKDLATHNQNVTKWINSKKD